MNRKDFILTCMTVFLVATLIVGCSSTNQIVSQAKGTIPTDRARILLTREIVSTGVGFVITDNETPIGQIGPGGQLEWDRVAGPMKLTARLINPVDGKLDLQYPSLSAEIGVGAGKSYHYLLHWGMNSHFPELKLISGTPVAYAQSNKNKADVASATTTATNDKQMIAQNSGSITDPSENKNILGINVEPTSGTRGVVVKTVAPGSPCASVLKPDDKIFGWYIYDQGNSMLFGAHINANNFQSEVSKIQPGMTVKFLLSLRPIRQVSCTIPAKAQRSTSPSSTVTLPKQ
jgi:hypothetical protein